MNCPECSNRSEVIDTRRRDMYNFKDSVYRRRRCLKCGTTFTTFELTQEQWTGVLKNIRREIVEDMISKLEREKDA